MFNPSVSSIFVDHVEEACYGNSFDDYLRPKCTADSVLYIHDVITYAKPLTSGCPETATIFKRDDARCCRYVNATDDCGLRYYGKAVYHKTHYTTCTGLTECPGVQVAWNSTLLFCNQSKYLKRTNYMRQIYNCIPSKTFIYITVETVRHHQPPDLVYKCRTKRIYHVDEVRIGKPRGVNLLVWTEPWRGPDGRFIPRVFPILTSST